MVSPSCSRAIEGTPLHVGGSAREVIDEGGDPGGEDRPSAFQHFDLKRVTSLDRKEFSESCGEDKSVAVERDDLPTCVKEAKQVAVGSHAR